MSRCLGCYMDPQAPWLRCCNTNCSCRCHKEIAEQAHKKALTDVPLEELEKAITRKRELRRVEMAKKRKELERILEKTRKELEDILDEEAKR